MRASKIFETVLYSDDLAACEEFYRDVLGLEVVDRSDLLVAFRCSDAVLLVFDPQMSGAPGRSVPSHGAIGPGHVAFAASNGELDGWRARLAEQGVEIESEVEWGGGARSIYFRDPARNSVELATPTLWGIDPTVYR